MSRLFAYVLGLLAVAPLNLGGANSGYSPHAAQKTEDDYSWEEAEGYEECEEFQIDQDTQSWELQ